MDDIKEFLTLLRTCFLGLFCVAMTECPSLGDLKNGDLFFMVLESGKPKIKGVVTGMIL